MTMSFGVSLLRTIIPVTGLLLTQAGAKAQIAQPQATPFSGTTVATMTSPAGASSDFRPGWKVYVVQLIRPCPNCNAGQQGYRLGAPELSYVHPADKLDIYARAYQAQLPGSAYGVVLKGFLNLAESGKHHIVTTLPKGPDVVCQQTVIVNGESVIATKHGHQLFHQPMIEQASADLPAGQTPIEIRLACAHEGTGRPTTREIGSKIQFRVQLKTPSADVLEPLRADQIVHSAATRFE
jgi:hypothetical protein